MAIDRATLAGSVSAINLWQDRIETAIQTMQGDGVDTGTMVAAQQVIKDNAAKIQGLQSALEQNARVNEAVYTRA